MLGVGAGSGALPGTFELALHELHVEVEEGQPVELTATMFPPVARIAASNT